MTNAQYQANHHARAKEEIGEEEYNRQQAAPQKEMRACGKMSNSPERKQQKKEQTAQQNRCLRQRKREAKTAAEQGADAAAPEEALAFMEAPAPVAEEVVGGSKTEGAVGVVPAVDRGEPRRRRTVCIIKVLGVIFKPSILRNLNSP